jgi:hypothetical protein
MPSKDTSYKSSIWDQSFLLTIATVFAGGLLYTIDALCSPEEREVVKPSNASIFSQAGAQTGDGGDD